jgi:putative peptidoglycan lipid II flippase
MVKKIKILLQTQIKGLHQAAYILGAFAILSQLFALIRDRLLAATFGAGAELDMYYAAFRLPDILFVLLAAFFSVSILVPHVIEKMEDEKELKRYFNSIFTFGFFLFIILFIAFWFIAPYFLKAVVPSMYVINSEELVAITRILLLQPILLSLSGFLGSFAQAQKKFLLYSMSPVMYNLGIILGISLLYPVYGISGLVFGVVLGAVLHVGILVPFTGQIYTPKFSRVYFSDIKNLIGHSIPRTFAMMSNQVLLVCVTFFAGLLATGSIAIFNLAYNLQSVPLAIIGVSYSLAAFPSLALFFQEKRYDEFYELLSRAMRHVFFWSLPVVACFIVLRAQIVRVILGSGNFDWNETILVAAALALFTLSLVAQSASQVLIRAFYAMGKTVYPFIATIVSFVITLGCMSLLFIPNLISSDVVLYFEALFKVDVVTSSLILLLPIAFTVGQWVLFGMLILGIGQIRKIFSKQFFLSISQSFAGAGVIALASYASLQLFSGIFDLDTFIGIAAQGFISGIIGLLSGFVFLVIIGNKEISTVLHVSLKKIQGQIITHPEVKEEL